MLLHSRVVLSELQVKMIPEIYSPYAMSDNGFVCRVRQREC